jgi:hypothetical protein
VITSWLSHGYLPSGCYIARAELHLHPCPKNRDHLSLWNTFIVAASVRALLARYGKRFITTISRMRYALACQQSSTRNALILADLYRQLPTLDFSHEVLEGQEWRLHVMRVPAVDGLIR